jgi:hypothetical protein
VGRHAQPRLVSLARSDRHGPLTFRGGPQPVGRVRRRSGPQKSLRRCIGRFQVFVIHAGTRGTAGSTRIHGTDKCSCVVRNHGGDRDSVASRADRTAGHGHTRRTEGAGEQGMHVAHGRLAGLSASVAVGRDVLRHPGPFLGAGPQSTPRRGCVEIMVAVVLVRHGVSLLLPGVPGPPFPVARPWSMRIGKSSAVGASRLRRQHPGTGPGDNKPDPPADNQLR